MKLKKINTCIVNILVMDIMFQRKLEETHQ